MGDVRSLRGQRDERASCPGVVAAGVEGAQVEVDRTRTKVTRRAAVASAVAERVSTVAVEAGGQVGEDAADRADIGDEGEEPPSSAAGIAEQRVEEEHAA